MTKLQINLSSRPFANYSLYHLGYVVIGLAGLLLMSHNAYWFFSNHGDVRQMEREIAALQTEVDGNIREARTLGDEIEEVQRNRRFRDICTFVDGRIRQRRFSWIRMLNLLQEAIPPDVKIESITPRVQPDSIRITLACMARRDDAVNTFIENLEGIEEFDRVLITSEDKEGGTVSFPLTMEYSPFGFSAAAGRRGTPAAPPDQADGGPAPGTGSGQEEALAEAVSLAPFPDPEHPDVPLFAGGDDYDPFAIEGEDPFAGGDGNLFASDEELPAWGEELPAWGEESPGETGGFGEETDTSPAPVTGSDPAPGTGPRKMRNSGELIKQPQRKPGERETAAAPGARAGRSTLMEKAAVSEKGTNLDRRDLHPKILIGFLAFLVLNLIFYGLVIHPGKKGLREKEERLEVIRRDQAISQRRLDAARADKAALDRTRLNLDTFYFDVLSTQEERMNPVRDEIARLAGQFNVNLAKRSYPAQEYADMGVYEFRIKFPLRGQFEDVGNFIGQIEKSENFLVIDRITLRTSDDTGRLLQLNFDLSTFFCAVDNLDTLMRRRQQN